MGSFCSCFDADDPLENTDNANYDNGIIPNLCNKVRTYVLELPTMHYFPPFVFSNLSKWFNLTNFRLSSLRSAMGKHIHLQIKSHQRLLLWNLEIHNLGLVLALALAGLLLPLLLVFNSLLVLRYSKRRLEDIVTSILHA